MSQLNPTITEANAYAASYIIKNCMTTAFKAAFPNSKANALSSNVRGHDLYKKSKIRVRITELEASAKQAAELEHLTSVKGIMESLLEVKDAALHGGVDSNSNEFAPNLSAANTSLQEVNRMKGHHAADKLDITSGGKVISNNWQVHPIAAVIDVTPEPEQLEPPE